MCPALFDVGEHAKVVIISVTEGQDKPLKYPHMFAVADLVIVNKTDLLPYVDFDVETFTGYAQSLNRTAEIMPCRSSQATASMPGMPGSTQRSAGSDLRPELLDVIRDRMLRTGKLHK